jgi:uncharacterized protein (TIGR03437 family)
LPANPLNPEIHSGSPVTGLSANTRSDRLMANIGGVEAPVDSVRPLAGSAGVLQVAVSIPAAAETGDSVPVAIREFLPDGRVASSQTATIAIEPVRP